MASASMFMVVGSSAGVAEGASAATADTLAAGQQLSAGQAIWSPNGSYQAVMQGDGNFVEYGPSGPIWATGTSSGAGTYVAMQGDGNLVVYPAGGRALWASNTAPSSGDRLVMQNDGNLVLYAGGGLALWSSHGGLTGNRQDTLATSQQLNQGQSITSLDGRFTAVMQADGNFVEYGPAGATWASGTGSGAGTYVAMQGDGNLVVYAPGGRAVWASNTAPSSGDRLVVQSDGNLVIYNGTGQALWAKGQLLGNSAAVDTFVSRYNNQFIDYDHVYGAQCVDLVQQFMHDVLAVANPASLNAYQYWSDSRVLTSFNQVAASQPAHKGDVAVWSASTPGSGGAGHVAIVLADGTALSVFQQNSPLGSPSVIGTHSKAYLLGYLRPKGW